jgi:hypothetical protein
MTQDEIIEMASEAAKGGERMAVNFNQEGT